MLLIHHLFTAADPDGYFGLSQTGTVVSYAAVVLLLVAAAVLISRKTAKKHMPTKQLVFCAMALALAFLTSFIKLFEMPWGGAVTLCSMFFICYIGYIYGLGAGLLTGFAYSLLQLIQDPWLIHPVQIFLDYIFAFTALGLSGLFSRKRNGLIIGYLAAIFARGIFASLAGYIFWYDSMPDSFPQILAWGYPIFYNYSYILAEGVITVIILCIPAVSKALNRVKQAALAEN